MLSIIADYQTDKHWIWDKESLDGYYIYSNQEHYIGFIYWCLTSKPVLHSVYVEESQRRQGHGTRMVKSWIEKFGDNTRFAVRDPEEEMKALLENIDAEFEEV
ncbi:MAG: GNAT family N-acetyltransferase [Candidatus Nanohaloarchaea archaeon]